MEGQVLKGFSLEQVEDGDTGSTSTIKKAPKKEKKTRAEKREMKAEFGPRR